MRVSECADPGPRIPSVLVALAHHVLKDPGNADAAQLLAEHVLAASEQR